MVSLTAVGLTNLDLPYQKVTFNRHFGEWAIENPWRNFIKIKGKPRNFQREIKWLPIKEKDWLASDFLATAVDAKKHGSNYLQYLKENNFEPKILYPDKAII